MRASLRKKQTCERKSHAAAFTLHPGMALRSGQDLPPVWLERLHEPGP